MDMDGLHGPIGRFCCGYDALKDLERISCFLLFFDVCGNFESFEASTALPSIGSALHASGKWRAQTKLGMSS